MDMRMRLGNPTILMVMDPTEWRECTPISSGSNTTLAVSFLSTFVLRVEIITEAVIEWILEGVD